MAPDLSPEPRINLFSLVSYLPDPLGAFIDRLREELVPGCCLRAHVTLLPPRPLACPVEEASRFIRQVLGTHRPIQVRLDNIHIFTVSSVVYLELAQGFQELTDLHAELNTGPLAFQEPFPYHPHVTLAQQITPDQVPDVFEHARYRWAEYRHSHSFLVDKATFVQAINLYKWVDLEDCPFGTLVAPRRTRKQTDY